MSYNSERFNDEDEQEDLLLDEDECRKCGEVVYAFELDDTGVCSTCRHAVPFRPYEQCSICHQYHPSDDRHPCE